MMALSLVGTNAIGQTATKKHNLKIVSVTMKVMHSDEDVAFVSWKVVVKNESSSDLRLFGTVNFLDSEGYIVDGDDFLGEIDAGEEKTFTGETPLQPDELKKVATIEAKLRER
jgi:hypothetical protein